MFYPKLTSVPGQFLAMRLLRALLLLLQSQAGYGGSWFGAWTLGSEPSYGLYVVNKDDLSNRSCSGATSNQGWNPRYCMEPPCYLENDLFSTDNATACRDRCLVHAVPKHKEACRHYSWGSRMGSKHYGLCYLTNHEASTVWDRRFTSGSCRGGATRSEAALRLEKQLCGKIMESVESLRVWLKVEQATHHLLEERYPRVISRERRHSPRPCLP